MGGSQASKNLPNPIFLSPIEINSAKLRFLAQNRSLKKVSVLLSLVFFAAASSYAQIGGATTYNFLRDAQSWRVTALGEINITTIDYDPTTQLSNPASLNPLMSRHASFSTVAYPGGVNYGNACYVQDFGTRGTYGMGLQYINYGDIPQTDASGTIIKSNLPANEINLYGGGSYRFGKIFSAGMNVKFIGSWLDSYHSYGLAADLGVSVNDTAHGIVASIVAKNIGGQLTPYTYGSGRRDPIPFDLQAGFSVKFKGFPVRFHLTFHDLQRWDIRYSNPADAQQNSLLGDTVKTSKAKVAVDEFFRHFIVGAELSIKKVVFIDFSYNDERRQEIAQTSRRSIAGFAVGIGVHVKMITVGIALSPMPLKSTLAQFTVTVNTGGFVKRKAAPKSPQGT